MHFNNLPAAFRAAVKQQVVPGKLGKKTRHYPLKHIRRVFCAV
jgi:hypothetical protein